MFHIKIGDICLIATNPGIYNKRKPEFEDKTAGIVISHNKSIYRKYHVLYKGEIRLISEELLQKI